MEKRSCYVEGQNSDKQGSRFKV
ncbi:hypothetical protein CFP56_007925 [Quercus suber]|uniref:Uncharacterized protein n=1 Tax=Quercus suber TaxID=58331 RepID=A0AAW0IDH5_QUESU